jgi:hypothetical protein
MVVIVICNSLIWGNNINYYRKLIWQECAPWFEKCSLYIVQRFYDYYLLLCKCIVKVDSSNSFIYKYLCTVNQYQIHSIWTMKILDYVMDYITSVPYTWYGNWQSCNFSFWNKRFVHFLKIRIDMKLTLHQQKLQMHTYTTAYFLTNTSTES